MRIFLAINMESDDMTDVVIGAYTDTDTLLAGVKEWLEETGGYEEVYGVSLYDDEYVGQTVVADIADGMGGLSIRAAYVQPAFLQGLEMACQTT